MNTVSTVISSEQLATFNKERTIRYVKKYGFALKNIHPDFLKDKDVVRSACESFPLAFGFADPELRRNKEFVMECVGNYSGDNLQFVKLSFRSDYDICLKAVQKTSTSIRFVDSILLEYHQDIALCGLYKNEKFFCHLPVQLKEDRVFILKALDIEFNVYYYLDEQLQDDLDIAFKVIKEDPSLFCDLSGKLQNTYELAKQAIQELPVNINYASNAIQNDATIIAIILQALTQNSSLFAKFNAAIRENYDIAKAAIEESPDNLAHVNDELRANCELVMTAVEKKPLMYKCAVGNASKDKRIIELAVKENKAIWRRYVPKVIQQEYEDVDDFLASMEGSYIKG